MTQEEYDNYLPPAVLSLAREEAVAFGFDDDEAGARAAEAFERLVPAGKVTDAVHLRVIEVGREPVGVLWYQLRNDGRDAYILDLLIRPAFRRRGLARQALTILETVLREAGVRAMFLSVFSHNPAAASLYASLGYRDRSRLMGKDLR